MVSDPMGDRIQRDLFALGAQLADGRPDPRSYEGKTRLGDEDVAQGRLRAEAPLLALKPGKAGDDGLDPGGVGTEGFGPPGLVGMVEPGVPGSTIKLRTGLSSPKALSVRVTMMASTLPSASIGSRTGKPTFSIFTFASSILFSFTKEREVVSQIYSAVESLLLMAVLPL